MLHHSCVSWNVSSQHRYPEINGLVKTESISKRQKFLVYPVIVKKQSLEHFGWCTAPPFCASVHLKN